MDAHIVSYPQYTTQAHQHAANADDAIAKGLLIPAAEHHQKAADAFNACIDHASDDGNKRTMRMLHDQHVKAARDIQRRIAKLRDENKDPALPQPYPVYRPLTTNQNHGNHPGAAPPAYHQLPTLTGPGVPARSTPPPPPPHILPRRTNSLTPNLNLADSQHTVDESFMVLGGQRSDPGDAFNQFWKIMEGMLDNLSQPVAFATVPLAFDPDPLPPARESSLSSDTDAEDVAPPRKTTLNGTNKAREDVVDLLDDDDDLEILVEDGNELTESFCLVAPSSSSSPSSSSAPAPVPAGLTKENTALRHEVDALRARLAQTERMLQIKKEQDERLKDSIVLARHQAQRAMAASVMIPGQNGRPQQQQPSGPGTGAGGALIDFGPMHMLHAPSPPPRDAAAELREAQLSMRVKELEEVVRGMRVENEKQKAMIAKFKERWEKLKESAKRKKEAKAAMVAAAGFSNAGGSRVVEKIDELPEPADAVQVLSLQGIAR